MASVSGSRRTLGARSGGKIIRERRTAGSRTPYERPRPADSEEDENPNWISRLILSPTRAIASGAGKLISTVFSQDDSDSDLDTDSDSDSSSSDGDSGSERNVENDHDNDDFLSQRDGILKERKGKSEMMKYFWKYPEPTAGKRDSKRAIEELIMQETFTREECKNLIKMIKLRVVDGFSSKDVENAKLTQTPIETSEEADEQNLRCTAVMEARRWLSEKKLRSVSKSNLDNVVDDEVGSPVDMAKLYMRTRPLWASPTFKSGEFKSLSPVGTHLFKEETPYSLGGNTLSSSKAKSNTPATGSWNIQEEIQRVRAKATEEMLRTLPSKKIDWSSFAFENRASQKSLPAENTYAHAIEKVCNAMKPIDAFLQTTEERCSAQGIQDLEKTPAGVQQEGSLPNEVTIVSEKNQELEVTHILNGGGPKDGIEDMDCEEQRLQSTQDIKTINASVDVVPDHKDTNATDKQLNNIIEESIQDPRLLDSNCSSSKEVAEEKSTYTANGLPPLGYSLSAEAVTEKDTSLDGEEHNPVSSSSNKIVTDIFGDGTCEFLSETSVDVPNLSDALNEGDYIANGSSNVSSMNDQSPRYVTRKGSKRSLAPNATGDDEKKQGKRLGRNNKRKQGIST